MSSLSMWMYSQVMKLTYTLDHSESWGIIFSERVSCLTYMQMRIFWAENLSFLGITCFLIGCVWQILVYTSKRCAICWSYGMQVFFPIIVVPFVLNFYASCFTALRKLLMSSLCRLCFMKPWKIWQNMVRKTGISLLMALLTVLWRDLCWED